jgi:hypothetical protein
MQSRSQIVDFCERGGIEVLFLPSEFDVAIIGLSVKFNEYSVLYDSVKCIECLMLLDNMTHDEAIEYFEFNIVGSYVGSNTPTFLVDIL